jgi:copper chaperone CopZ
MSAGGGTTEDSRPPLETIVLRYYQSAELEPKMLKPALEKVKGVEKVDVDTVRCRVRVDWRGKCKDLALLESTAQAAGTPAHIVSHAHVYLALKPLKGAVAETLTKELQAIKGVKGAVVQGMTAELHANLDELQIKNLRSALEAGKFDGQLKSHQFVEAPVTAGDTGKVSTELDAVRGVLTTDIGADRVSFWAVKAVTDAMIKRAVEKAGATMGDLARP